MLYELATGHIVTEDNLKLAYEVCRGKKANEDSTSYRKWKSYLSIKPISDDEITVEQLIKGDAFVQACMLYRDQHKCTLAEAREVCIQIKTQMMKA